MRTSQGATSFMSVFAYLQVEHLLCQDCFVLIYIMIVIEIPILAQIISAEKDIKHDQHELAFKVDKYYMYVCLVELTASRSLKKVFFL